MSGRAQFSFDLMVVVGIMLVLFLSLFQFYISKSESVQIVREKTEAKALAENIAKQINSVLQAGNGSSASTMLPQKLDDGEDYSISVANRRVEIAVGGATASELVATSAVSPTNLDPMKGSRITFTNIGGGISIQ
ncbi:MAG: hypothetical protein V1835_05640 [Candidatus Micrarchaeota archaeon]